MSKSKATKKPAKKSPTKKTSAKEDAEFVPAVSDDELDELDLMIEELAASKKIPKEKKASEPLKRKPEDKPLDVREFLDLEAECKPKKSRKEVRHWSATEAVLLKLLVVGQRGMGRNVSGT